MLSLVLVLVLNARAARAEGPLLSWDAPSGCPERVALLEAIRARLDANAWQNTAPELVADVRVRAVPGGFALTLETASRQGPSGKRYIEAASCGELIDAAALIVALAIDPRAAERAPQIEREAASPFALPLGDQAPATAPQTVPVAGAPEPVPTPGTRAPTELAPAEPEPAKPAPIKLEPAKPAAAKPAPVEPAPKPAPRARGQELAAEDLIEPAPSGARAPTSAPARTQRFFFVRPLLLLDLGTLQRLAVGPALQLGVRFSPITLELGAGLLPEQTLTAAGRDVGDLYWLGASAGACYGRLLGERIELAPCARLEYGRLHASSRETSAGPTSGAAPWLAASLGVRASYQLSAAIAVVADLAFGLPLLAAAFSIEGVGEVHRTPHAVGRLNAGIELRF